MELFGILGVLLTAIGVYYARAQVIAARKTVPAATLPSPKPPSRRLRFFVTRLDKEGRDFVQGIILTLREYGVVALWGPDGMGKTSLALETAHQLYPSITGVIWVDLESCVRSGLSELCNEICIQLEREDARTLPIETKQSLARSLLSRGSYLLVLDAFQAVGDEDAVMSFVRQLPCSVLVTTCALVQDVFCIKVPQMSEPEAQGLIASFVTHSSKAQRLKSVEPTAIAKAAEGIPMLIVWILGQLESAVDAQDVFAEIEASTGDVGERVFASSFRILGEDAQNVLLASSLFRAGAKPDELAVICDLPSRARLHKAIAKLSESAAHGVTIDAKRVEVTGLTRTRARARADIDERGNRLRVGLVSYFLSFSEAHSQETPECFDALEPERVNVMTAMQEASKLGRWQDVIRLWRAVSTFLWVRGYWDDYVDCDQWALEATKRIEDEDTRPIVLSELGWAAVERADYAQATDLLDEAYERFRLANRREWLCIVQAYLTIAELRQGHLDEAEQHCREGLALAVADEYPVRATLTIYLGCVYRKRGALEEARQILMSVLDSLRAQDDRRRLMVALFDLGSLEFEEGNTSEAQRLYEEALQIAQGSGQADLVAGLSYRLARIAEQAGSLQRALVLTEKALALYRTVRKAEDRSQAEQLLQKITERLSASAAGQKDNRWGTEDAELGRPSYSWRFGQERRLALMLNHVALQGKSIVDIGCGVGMYMHAFLSQTPLVFGTEIEPERARECSQMAPAVAVAVAEHLPFASDSFDCAFLHEVIEHVEDDREAIREAYRIVRPGGRIVVFAPNRLYPFETHGVFWGRRYRFGNIPLVNYFPNSIRDRLAPHVRAYTAGQIRCLFEGLDVEFEAFTQLYPGFDSLAARHPRTGATIRRIFYAAENTPLRAFGLSHFVVARVLAGSPAVR